MAVFVVLQPYLLTTKLRSVIRHNLGHSKPQCHGEVKSSAERVACLTHITFHQTISREKMRAYKLISTGYYSIALKGKLVFVGLDFNDDQRYIYCDFTPHQTFNLCHRCKILKRCNKIPHCNVHRELRGCLEVPPTLKQLLAVTFLSFDDKNMAPRLNLSTRKKSPKGMLQNVCIALVDSRHRAVAAYH